MCVCVCVCPVYLSFVLQHGHLFLEGRDESVQEGDHEETCHHVSQELGRVGKEEERL